ncbi:hypothetical protein FACS1894202_11140 [Clostridia bacterium]|nr:hypothetical protein FACS1894202_11140 [Clostridia bacterium]
MKRFICFLLLFSVSAVAYAAETRSTEFEINIIPCELVVKWENAAGIAELKLTAPDGVVYDNLSAGYREENGGGVFTLAAADPVGLWQLEITGGDLGKISVSSREAVPTVTPPSPPTPSISPSATPEPIEEEPEKKSPVPLIAAFLLLVLLIAASFIVIKRLGSKNIKTLSVASTAQEFVGVRDIRGESLYTSDGHVVAYIRLSSMSVELMSEREKVRFTEQLTGALSSEREPFKLLCVSRSVDISTLTQEYAELAALSDNPIHREILRRETKSISEYSLSDDVSERQFYICVWRKTDNGGIVKRANELAEKFSINGVNCSVLKEREIVRLCNMVTNPAYVHIEDVTNSFTASIPFLKGVSDNG